MARRLTDSYLRDRKSVEENLAASVVPLARSPGMRNSTIVIYRHGGMQRATRKTFSHALLNSNPRFRSDLETGNLRRGQNQDAPLSVGGRFLQSEAGRKALEFVRDHSAEVEKAVPAHAPVCLRDTERHVKPRRLTSCAASIRRAESSSRSSAADLERIEQCSRILELQSPKLSRICRGREGQGAEGVGSIRRVIPSKGVWREGARTSELRDVPYRRDRESRVLAPKGRRTLAVAAKRTTGLSRHPPTFLAPEGRRKSVVNHRRLTLKWISTPLPGRD